MRKAAALALAVLALLSGGCVPPEQLMGEGGAPGYLTRPVPEKYRGERNPFTPADAEAVAAGQVLYARHCLRCHGAQGRGDGPQAPDLEPLPANYSARMIRAAFRDHQDYLFAVVSEGKPQTGMPPFRHVLSPTERWQVLTYSWHLGER